jgi:hypothetical protein
VFVILNSDVIHTSLLIANGLPAYIDEFCREAASLGASLVLPRTTVLENQRHQEELTENLIAKIENAVTLLKEWSVEVPEIFPRQLIPKPDLVSALALTGVRVRVEEPALREYRDAENRACLHLPPWPPDTKSDEMRDLVIWELALRLAKEHGKAILVSRDKIHTGDSGAAEAEAAGLLRARDFDEALDLLGRESPAAKLAGSVLQTVWSELIGNGLPLPNEASVRRVRQSQFVTDDLGRAEGRFQFSVDGPEGTVTAEAAAEHSAPNTVVVHLREITVAENAWKTGELTVQATGELPTVAGPAAERLTELRKMIGDTE